MSKLYAITGGATGIGAALKEKLRKRGDTVIVVDIKDGDVIADLSTSEGRDKAIEGIKQKAPQGLDGFIPCAGLGPSVKPYDLITRVNFFGAVATIQGLKPLCTVRRG